MKYLQKITTLKQPNFPSFSLALHNLEYPTPENPFLLRESPVNLLLKGKRGKIEVNGENEYDSI